MGRHFLSLALLCAGLLIHSLRVCVCVCNRAQVPNMGIVLICIVLVHFALARLSGWLCTCLAAYTGTAELEFGLDLACAQLAQQSWRRMRIRPAAFLLVFCAALGLMFARCHAKINAFHI